jgi:hypothetical protein
MEEEIEFRQSDLVADDIDGLQVKGKFILQTILYEMVYIYQGAGQKR